MHPMLQAAVDAAQKLTDEEQIRVAQTVFQLIAGVTEVQATKGQVPRRKRHAKAGSAKGLILYMADDFDAPLDDFKDAM